MRDAKRALAVLVAVWGASWAGKKSGKEGPMSKYRLKATLNKLGKLSYAG